MSSDDSIFDDVSLLEAAASAVSLPTQSKPATPPTPAPAPKPAAVVPQPPSSPVMTKEDVQMEEYNVEKKKLEDIYQQLINLSHGDSCGEIIRNFGLSQLVIKVGDAIDRTNGLVLLRALKSKINTKSMEGKQEEKDNACKKIGTSEAIVTSLYEVWGVMEDGSIGLTACYAPEMVAFVVSLKSGLDQPPEVFDDED
jgi:hypothetical protein